MNLVSFTTALPRQLALAALVGIVAIGSAGYAQNSSAVIVVDRATIGPRLERDAAPKGASVFVLGAATGTARRQESSLSDQSQLVSPTQEDLARARAAIRTLNNDTAASGRRFFITDLGTLGGTESFAYALNVFGQVSGASRLAGDAITHSFLYSSGTMKDLFPLNSEDVQTVGPTGINNFAQVASGVIVDGIYVPAIRDNRTGDLILLGDFGGNFFGFNGVATSINDSGHAVGYSYLDSVSRHAFLYRNGTMTDIGSFGGDSGALAINALDQVVGFATDPNTGVNHAFKYINGAMTQIGPDTESVARDINIWGQVVGSYLTSDQTAFRGFLSSGRNFADFGSGPETDPFAINDLGQIVGVFLKPFVSTCNGESCIEYKQHAFLAENRKVVDLNGLIPGASGWELTWAFDVNDLGQIAGYGLVKDKFRAFLLTPAISAIQCKNNGWKRFGFKNQGQCIQFVKNGK